MQAPAEFGHPLAELKDIGLGYFDAEHWDDFLRAARKHAQKLKPDHEERNRILAFLHLWKRTKDRLGGGQGI